MNGQHQGVTLGLANQKGGASKTTTTAALATIFSQDGYKVLAVDNDPQGHLSLQFGVDALSHSRARGTVADLYLGRKSVAEVVVATDHAGVDLVPATIELAEVEMNLPGMQGADLRLEVALQEARASYDIIVLDAPPNLGKLALNVLAASDYFIVPVDGAWALRSVDTLVAVAERNARFYRLNNRFLGIFLTMVDRTNIVTALREETAARYPDHLLRSSIRRATSARESAAFSQPLPIYAYDAEVTKDYVNLAHEVAERMGL